MQARTSAASYSWARGDTVSSFLKQCVQQIRAPADPQSNLMVLVQWHQKASTSSLHKRSTGSQLFWIMHHRHKWARVQCEARRGKALGMQTPWLRAERKQRFLNEVTMPPVTPGQEGTDNHVHQKLLFDADSIKKSCVTALWCYFLIYSWVWAAFPWKRFILRIWAHDVKFRDSDNQ